MKKVLSVIIAVVMLVAVFAVPAYAQSTGHEYLCEDKFMEYMHEYDSNLEVQQYRELAQSVDEQGNIEWVLMHAFVVPMESWPQIVFACDMFIESSSSMLPFGVGYGVYTGDDDGFHGLPTVDVEKYDGLEEAIKANIEGRPLGDADNDKVLTILDATAIQRHLAQIEQLNDNIYVYGSKYKYYSDMDFDGERTILDATAIQRKLAQYDL